MSAEQKAVFITEMVGHDWVVVLFQQTLDSKSNVERKMNQTSASTFKLQSGLLSKLCGFGLSVLCLNILALSLNWEWAKLPFRTLVIFQIKRNADLSQALLQVQPPSELSCTNPKHARPKDIQ